MSDAPAMDPFDLMVTRLAIVHALLRRAEELRRAAAADRFPERSRSGQLLWLQANGTRTTITGGRGRRR